VIFNVVEVKDHYKRHYVSGNIGNSTRVRSRKYKVTDHTGPVEGPLSPTLMAPLPPLNLSVPEARELGFLPLRDDFEREWDNDAESVLSSAIIHHTDEEVDMAYKLSLVSMYRYVSIPNAGRRAVRTVPSCTVTYLLCTVC